MRVIDEQVEIERLLNPKSVIGVSPSQSDLNLLAKHFRSEGKGKIGIRKALLKYCKEHYVYFNPIIFRQAITKAVRIGMKSKIRLLRDVLLTRDELREIRTVPYFKLQQILFSMLVFVKSMNPVGEKGIFSNGIDVSNFRWILKASDTRMSLTNFKKHLFYLESTGLISTKLTWKTNSTITSLLYVGDFFPENHILKVEGKIEELEKAGTLYKKFCGGFLYWCTGCGKEGIKNSNRQTRCEDCTSLLDKWRKR